MTLTDPIVVLPATGKTGRRVADRLEASGLPVRRASRTSDTPFDWTDRSTWTDALMGASAAYVAYVPDIAVPGAGEDVVALAELATRLGVGRLVLLSGRGEPEAIAAERAFAAAAEAGGATWSVVRASWFAQNFVEGFLADAVRSGELALPVGDVPEPFVDVDDLADVAVVALTEDGQHGVTHEVTGPRALTFDEAAEQLGIRLVRVPLDAFTDALRGEGVPDGEVDLIAYLFSEILDGRNAEPTDGIERALGRPPRGFEQSIGALR